MSLLVPNAIEAITQPSRAALLYFAFAFPSASIAAYINGTLTSITTHPINGSLHIVRPFIQNYSTVIDFLILNPVCIYFLLKSIRELSFVFKKRSCGALFSAYHLVGINAVSMAVSFLAVKFYVAGFLNGDYFDSNFMPGMNGKPYLTASGIVVFFWTWLYIYIITCCTLIYSAYVSWLMHLRESDIKYNPFDRDDSGGLKYLASPVFNFFNALIVLLVTLVVFYIQDHYCGIDESNRLLGFIIFIVIGIPLFIVPVLHMRNMMVKKKGSYYEMISTHARSILNYESYEMSSPISDCMPLFNHIESIDKCWLIVARFPQWPMPRRSFLAPISAFTAAALPLLNRLIGDYIKAFFIG